MLAPASPQYHEMSPDEERRLPDVDGLADPIKKVSERRPGVPHASTSRMKQCDGDLDWLLRCEVPSQILGLGPGNPRTVNRLSL